MTKDGNPYGPARYKELVRERYFISKSMNTSYNELGKITPLERKYILEFIVEEKEREQKAIEELNAKNKKH